MSFQKRQQGTTETILLEFIKKKERERELGNSFNSPPSVSLSLNMQNHLLGFWCFYCYEKHEMKMMMKKKRKMQKLV